VPTVDMIADILTKPCSKQVFQRLAPVIMGMLPLHLFCSLVLPPSPAVCPTKMSLDEKQIFNLANSLSSASSPFVVEDAIPEPVRSPGPCTRSKGGVLMKARFDPEKVDRRPDQKKLKFLKELLDIKKSKVPPSPAEYQGEGSSPVLSQCLFTNAPLALASSTADWPTTSLELSSSTRSPNVAVTPTSDSLEGGMLGKTASCL